MKRLLIIIILLAAVKTAPAQKSLLSLDEHSKYIFYQVVDMPGFTADSLERNSNKFIAAISPKNKIIQKNEKGEVSIADKFLTYTAITKHESGAVSYLLTIECKNNKYRYWISNFVFTPYQRDRFSNFVPQAGVNYPLEDSIKFDRKELDSYLNQASMYCKQLGEKLKWYVTGAPALKKAEILKKVVTDDW